MNMLYKGLRYLASLIAKSIVLLFLQHGSHWGRHHSTCFGSVLALEVVRHLLKCHPFDTFVLVDVVDDPETLLASQCHFNKSDFTFDAS